MVANAINRNEINTLTAENGRLKKNNDTLSSGKSNPALSKEAIQEKLAEAEKNKDNFTYQKNLGMALYRYSNMTQDAELLPDIQKLLSRANNLNQDDYEVLVTLGNVNFDIGRIKRKSEAFEKAREFYRQALEKNTQDINVRTDLGWTYLSATPPNPMKAVDSFQKSLQINPKHEKSLQLMSQSLIMQGKVAEAREYLVKLKQVNPQNQELSKLEKQLETEKK